MNNLTFSQRNGLKPIRELIQKDKFDKETQNRLLNYIFQVLVNSKIYSEPESLNPSTIMISTNKIKIKPSYINFIIDFYEKILNKPIHKIREFKFLYNTEINYLHKDEQISNYIFYLSEFYIFDLKEIWFNSKYNEQLDIIEIFVKAFPETRKNFNNLFKELSVGYRIINNQITDIINEEEIKSIEKSSEKSNHITKAMNLLYGKEKDYKNSIKESISAVEQVCKEVTGQDNSTLGQCIPKLEEKLKLHPSFKEMLKNAWKYTNDESGIRHSEKDKKTLVDFEEAKLILIFCSGIVNYLKEKVENNN